MDRTPEARRRRPPSALLPDARGATAVEYGLILSLVVLVVFGAIVGLGGQSLSIWTNVQTAVTNAH